MDRFDSLRWTRGRLQAVRPALGFPGGSVSSVRGWQQRLRARIRGRLGVTPTGRVVSGPRRVSRKGFPEYVREGWTFSAAPGLEAFAWWLVPRRFTAPGPCVICVPGHGRGVDPIVGIGADGRQRPFGRWGEYQNDFALQCVARGYAVLALEPLGFGRRRDPAARRKGPETSSCQPAAGAALLLGETMLGWRVRDAMAAVTLVRARPEVDPRRIAIMGISGGGTVSLFSAALDTRIAAAVVSGYVNTFTDSVGSLSHCIDNYVPGLFRDCEMSDVAGLIAPRPLFVESGTRDEIFPVAATRRAVRAARGAWRALRASGQLGSEIFRGGHRFHGRGAFAFLASRL